MAYQVSLSRSARLDLRQIVKYIGSVAPEREIAFGHQLISSTRNLGTFPEMGRIVPEFARFDLREIVFRPYRIVYQVDHADCYVRVLRFWHGARGTPMLDIDG